jgi:hypothetical protein
MYAGVLPLLEVMTTFPLSAPSDGPRCLSLQAPQVNSTLVEYALT